MNSVYDKKLSVFQLCMAVFCVVLILVTLSPILNIVATSFSGKNAIAKGIVGLVPRDFTTEAYKSVFGNSNIVYSLFYSLVLTVGCALLNVFMTILSA